MIPALRRLSGGGGLEAPGQSVHLEETFRKRDPEIAQVECSWSIPGPRAGVERDRPQVDFFSGLMVDW